MIIVPTNSISKIPVTIQSISHITGTTTVSTNPGEVVFVLSIYYSTPPTSSGWTYFTINNANSYGNRQFYVNYKVATSSSVTIPSELCVGEHTTVLVASNCKTSSAIGAYSSYCQGWNSSNVWYINYVNSPALTGINTSGTSLFVYMTWYFNPSDGSASNVLGAYDNKLTQQPIDTFVGGSNSNYRCFTTYDTTVASRWVQTAAASNAYGGLASQSSFVFEILGAL